MAERSKKGKGANKRLLFLAIVLLIVLACAVYYFIFNANYSADSTVVACPKYRSCAEVLPPKLLKTGIYQIQYLSLKSKQPVNKEIIIKNKVYFKGFTKGSKGSKNYYMDDELKTDKNGHANIRSSLYSIDKVYTSWTGKKTTKTIYYTGWENELSSSKKDIYVYALKVKNIFSVYGKNNYVIRQQSITPPFQYTSNKAQATKQFEKFNNTTKNIYIDDTQLP